MDQLYPTHWSISKKIAFRFIFIFFTLIIIIQNNGAFPGWGFVMMLPTQLLHTVIPWIGKHILNLPYDITVFTNGSGDTTYDYMVVLFIAVVSLFGTLVLMALDRKRTNYTVLFYWLTVVV